MYRMHLRLRNCQFDARSWAKAPGCDDLLLQGFGKGAGWGRQVSKYQSLSKSASLGIPKSTEGRLPWGLCWGDYLSWLSWELRRPDDRKDAGQERRLLAIGAVLGGSSRAEEAAWIGGMESRHQAH